MDSSLAEIFIEFKWNTDDDPFHGDDNHTSLLRCIRKADDNLGQITSYIAAQLGAQFRMHAYFVFIMRGTARILCWDRSGAIVMEAFEYNRLPHLVEFFHWY